jgi:hypothetical protein
VKLASPKLVAPARVQRGPLLPKSAQTPDHS